MKDKIAKLLLSLLLIDGIARGDTPESATSDPSIAELVAQLDADHFAVRESATERLLAIGSAAAPALAVASQGESLEAADRAVWLLDKLAEDENRVVQRVALQALLAADRFPNVQDQAKSRLDDLCEAVCREEFERLGGSLIVKHPFDPMVGIVTLAEIELGPEWKGGGDAFAKLADLRDLHTIEITGERFVDKSLEHMINIKSLRQIRVTGSSVSPAIVTKLKAANPDLYMMIENDSMLGVHYMPTGEFTISSVIEDSPASQAGLQPGDVIAKFDGKPIDSFDVLTAHVSQHRPGTEVKIEVRRGEELLAKQIRLGARVPVSGMRR